MTLRASEFRIVFLCMGPCCWNISDDKYNSSFCSDACATALLRTLLEGVGRWGGTVTP